MNNLVMIAIIFGLSFFNGTDTKIIAEPEMVIEETVKIETEVKETETINQEELKEDEIQLFIDKDVYSELGDVGFEFSVDGYEIYNRGALIYFTHSVNKDAIKDIGGISVRMNWELEDGRNGSWEKNVFTKVNSVSYEEQRYDTLPILTEIVDMSELNNAHLHFNVRINEPVWK